MNFEFSKSSVSVLTTLGNVLNLDFAKAKTAKYLTVNSTCVKKKIIGSK